MTPIIATIGLIVVFFVSYYWDLNKKLSSEIDLHQKISSLEGMDSELVAYSEKKIRKEILSYYAIRANRKVLSGHSPFLTTPAAVSVGLEFFIIGVFLGVAAWQAPSNALGIATKVIVGLFSLIFFILTIWIAVTHHRDRKYLKQIYEIHALRNVDKSDIDILSNIYRRLKEKEIPHAEMSDLPTTTGMNSSAASPDEDAASID